MRRLRAFISEATQVLNENRHMATLTMNTELRHSGLRLLLTNPSIRAATLFVLASRANRSHLIYRNLLMALHSCDVSKGAVIEGPLLLPHPIGIVIGKGAEIGPFATIYQGVTIGTDGSGQYPTIGRGVTIYTDSLIVGDVEIPVSSSVRAKSFITPTGSIWTSDHRPHRFGVQERNDLPPHEGFRPFTDDGDQDTP